MPLEQIVVLAFGLVAIAALAGLLAWTSAQAAGRGPDDRDPAPREAPRSARDLSSSDDPPTTGAWPSTGRLLASAAAMPGTGRQVGRVVAFLFLASVAVVVALPRAWPDTEAAIFTLLAAGTLLVVFFMDLLPAASLGQARRFVEGIGAVAFLGILTGLTGGIGSPFVVGSTWWSPARHSRAKVSRRWRWRDWPPRHSPSSASWPQPRRRWSPWNWPGWASTRSRSCCLQTSRPPAPVPSGRRMTRRCEPRASMSSPASSIDPSSSPPWSRRSDAPSAWAAGSPC
ncbi:hypothetical protein BH23CHL8_BH23CHL8_14680 [soil metagenome]